MRRSAPAEAGDAERARPAASLLEYAEIRERGRLHSSIDTNVYEIHAALSDAAAALLDRATPGNFRARQSLVKSGRWR